VKWEGRSRRGWNTTDALAELRRLPPGLVLDGEAVAFNAKDNPHFPLLARASSTTTAALDDAERLRRRGSAARRGM
jgi:ATP-dependent DNA ligase